MATARQRDEWDREALLMQFTGMVITGKVVPLHELHPFVRKPLTEFRPDIAAQVLFGDAVEEMTAAQIEERNAEIRERRRQAEEDARAAS